MSRGSHIIRQVRAVFSASGGLFFIPREHLLFLYPQWVRNVSTIAQDLNAHSPPNTPPTGHDHSFNNARILNFSSVHEDAALELLEYEKRSEKEHGPIPLVRESLSQPVGSAQCENKSISDQAQPGLGNYGSSTTVPDIKASDSPLRLSRTIRRILASQRKRVVWRAYDKLAREDYEEKKVSQRMDGVPNWRDILHGLESHTPDGSEDYHDVLKISVPARAGERLLFGEWKSDLWATKMRFGCQIEVSRAEDSPARRVVTISGPLERITKAAAEILRVAPRAVLDEADRSQRVPTTSAETEEGQSDLPGNKSSMDVRQSFRANRHQRMAAPVRADQVLRPPVWTSESLGLYVQNLLGIKMSSHVHMILYNRDENHADAVVKILQGLFTDPECRAVVSVVTFNDVVAYLVKRSAIHVVRELFVSMEMQSLRMNTESFNIMLRGIAKSRSVGKFHRIFWLMIRRGYKPNADTWLAFMSAMENLQIKAHILKGMKSKGLLQDPQIRRQVCENFVETEVNHSLGNDMTQDQFFAHMADRFGEDWLTTNSGSRVLDSLGSRGLISRCWNFLELMHIKAVKISEVCVLTVVRHCQKQRNAQGAIEFIRRVSSLINFEPSQELYRVLFNIAWRDELHCVARIVWRYACLNSETTYIMRQRIIAGVQTDISNSSQSPEHKHRPCKEWKATAGRFILGIPTPPSDQKHSLLPEDVANILPPVKYRATIQASTSPTRARMDPGKNHLNLMEDDADPAEQDSPPSDTESSSKAIAAALEEQIAAFIFWKPQRPFADVLVEAFEKDQEWASSGKSREDNRLEWLYSNAPATPLFRKEGSAMPRRMPWDGE